jgi:hypothetical protein
LKERLRCNIPFATGSTEAVKSLAAKTLRVPNVNISSPALD